MAASALLLVAGLPATAPAAEVGDVVVRFAERTTPAERSAAADHVGGDVTESVGSLPGEVRVIDTPKPSDEAARDLEAHPGVVWAEPVVPYRLDATNDPEWPHLWGLENTGQPLFGQVGLYDVDVDAESAWPVSRGAGTAVAVVDSGVNPHDDLAGRLLPTRNFVGGPSSDEHGHGTHVAGTIVALAGNGVGTAGVAPATVAAPYKVFDANANSTSVGIADAFARAGEAGYRIVNASFGGGFSQVIEDAIAASPRTLFVAGSGNDAKPASFVHPCASPSPNVICVGAIRNDGHLASYSNYGDVVDIYAPGDLIVSTLHTGGYGFKSGTSMAAPHVSGIAALLLARDPGLSTTELRDLVLVGKPSPHMGRIAGAAQSLAAQPTTPQILSAEATAVSTSRAQVATRVRSRTTATTVVAQWRRAGAGNWATTSPQSVPRGATRDLSFTIDGLEAGGRYDVRIGAGTVVSAPQSVTAFAAPTVQAPQVDDVTASSFTMTSVVWSGTSGVSARTELRHPDGTVTTLGQRDLPAGRTTTLSEGAIGLRPASRYATRVVVSGAHGAAETAWTVVDTLAAVPSVASVRATPVAADGVDVAVAGHANGAPATVTVVAIDMLTGTEREAGAGTTGPDAFDLRASLRGLVADRGYEIVTIAENRAGRSFGPMVAMQTGRAPVRPPRFAGPVTTTPSGPAVVALTIPVASDEREATRVMVAGGGGSAQDSVAAGSVRSATVTLGPLPAGRHAVTVALANSGGAVSAVVPVDVTPSAPAAPSTAVGGAPPAPRLVVGAARRVRRLDATVSGPGRLQYQAVRVTARRDGRTAAPDAWRTSADGKIRLVVPAGRWRLHARAAEGEAVSPTVHSRVLTVDRSQPRLRDATARFTRRAITVRLASSEAGRARVRVTGRVDGRSRSWSAERTVDRKRRTVTVPITPRAIAALGRVRLTITLSDLAGNRRTSVLTVRR